MEKSIKEQINDKIRGYLSTVDADVVTGKMIVTEHVSRGSYIAPFQADEIMALVEQLTEK